LKTTVRVDAKKEKMDRPRALALARTVDRILTGRGAKIVAIEVKGRTPPDDELAAALLGPTGNLKAPTLKVGRTLLVGFNAAAWGEVF
jgi:hypothetical protein